MYQKMSKNYSSRGVESRKIISATWIWKQKFSRSYKILKIWKIIKQELEKKHLFNESKNKLAQKNTLKFRNLIFYVKKVFENGIVKS